MKLKRATLSETKTAYTNAILWSKREMEKIEKKEKNKKELVKMINAIRRTQRIAKAR